MFKKLYEERYPLHAIVRKTDGHLPEKISDYTHLVNTGDNQGIPPLFYAKTKSDALWLIEHGANVNARFRQYNPDFDDLQYHHTHTLFLDGVGSCFEAAMMTDRYDVASLLIERGAKVKRYFERTQKMPICYVAGTGFVGIVRMMIARGAKVNGLLPHHGRSQGRITYNAIFNLATYDHFHSNLYHTHSKVEMYDTLIAHSTVKMTYTNLNAAILYLPYEVLVTFFAHLLSSEKREKGETKDNMVKRYRIYTYSIPWISIARSTTCPIERVEKLKLIIATGLFKRTPPGKKKIRELTRYEMVTQECMDLFLEIVLDSAFPSLFDLIWYDLIFRDHNSRLESIRTLTALHSRMLRQYDRDLKIAKNDK